MRGKVPRDPRFRILEGKGKPSEVNLLEPVSEIKPPRGLSKEARNWLKRNKAELLEAEVITALDLDALWVFARLAGQIERLDKLINEHGELIAGRQQGLIKNPALGALRSAIGEYRKFCEAFGMVPLGRSRVMAKSKAKDSKMALYID
jgi:P27 family predicted phage terminase small subunit